MRHYGAAASLPITSEEFQNALSKLLKPVGNRKKLGFAISGGVDSMALAALYNEAQSVDELLSKPHAFIVDHKVRPESTEEAEWVARELRSKFGMESTILPLTWRDEFDSKRFETEARTLRYQALGRACRDMKITSLMVGHHADDQAETVMMRLSNYRLRSGLQAMQRVEWIPECEGIYGVYHSGRGQKPDPDLDIPFLVEQGGIQVLRPLLGFEKARLIATCEEKKVGWAEDQTNQIQSLTSRNAIRHLYKNYRLPQALSVPSLVDLSIHMQERINWHKDSAHELLDQCLFKLDIRTGRLVVRFPPFSALLPRPIKTEADMNVARNTAYWLIERVAELVTPKFKAPLAQLSASIEHIYPEMEQQEDVEASGHWNTVRKTNYNVYSIWWRFWDQPTPFPKHKEDGINLSLPHLREWMLTRQPLSESEKTDGSSYFEYPPRGTSSADHVPLRKESYRLIDGRWWIRIRNLLPDDTLILRMFHKSDLEHSPRLKSSKKQIDDTDTRHPYRYMAAALSLLDPPDLRFTIPAVFRKHAKTGVETIVGFPTLDVRVDGFGQPDDVCEWNVRYKKINLGPTQSMGDVVVPGISRKDIIMAEKRHESNYAQSAWHARKIDMKMKEVERNRLAGFKHVLSVDVRDKKKRDRKLDKLEALARAKKGEGDM
ncbi:Mitochondrial tRNA(Ile)-lysidine synthetase [Pyrenophora tritici-repentis]|nr:Mitochondrial tRNA(Ile)-lysidine synthetase [Pyrenophora tritici-repentis]